jgi:hypothetical protein
MKKREQGIALLGSVTEVRRIAEEEEEDLVPFTRRCRASEEREETHLRTIFLSVNRFSASERSVVLRTGNAATDDPGSDDGDEDGAVHMREELVVTSKEKKRAKERTQPCRKRDGPRRS